VPGSPTAEICDGVDNDCDAQTDEGNPGGGAACSTGQQGVCAAGTDTCQGGIVQCVRNVNPSAEICDNLDNNCDGTVDSFATACGVGACASIGTCTAGSDSCVAGTPTAESCDGVDNNCNGQTDEGNPGGGGACATGQAGVCAAGTQFCQTGALACVRNVNPSAETCDGLDNDCNGAVDGFATACGVGACARAGLCTAGSDSCTPGAPSAEICDNQDNDCNGVVDAFSTACGVGGCARAGVCTLGVNSCVAGTPSAENCDNIDNNCNGQTDEGNPGGGGACVTGQPGVCSPGALACQSGAIACVRLVNPSAEVCDGIDNDCTGVVDNGTPDADGDGRCDNRDDCASAYNPAQTDGDLDTVGDACDNCPSAYNPAQTDSDGDGSVEGGDACDITVTFPLGTDVACTDPPPTVRWSMESYNRFRVYVSAVSTFTGKQKFTSGDTLLKVATYTIPAKKWAKVCAAANPNLFIKVFGKSTLTKATEFSEVATATVK